MCCRFQARLATRSEIFMNIYEICKTRSWKIVRRWIILINNEDEERIKRTSDLLQDKSIKINPSCQQCIQVDPMIGIRFTKRLKICIQVFAFPWRDYDSSFHSPFPFFHFQFLISPFLLNLSQINNLISL